MPRPDPEKVRAMQERAAKRYREKRKAKALRDGVFSSLPRSGAGEPRRSPMRRSAIKPVSKKRAKENRERAAVLREMTDHAPVACQRCDMAEAVDAHEVVKRSQGGSITDPSNIRLLCRDCHDWVHDNQAAAEAEGWLSRVWQERNA